MKQSAPTPSPLQLKIRDACIRIETRFLQHDARSRFCIKFIPSAILMLVALFVEAIPAPLTLLLVGISAYVSVESAARRFRDLGEKANRVLHLIIPLFVCWWIGPQIPESYHLQKVFIALLCAYPAFLLLRLVFTAGASGRKA